MTVGDFVGIFNGIEQKSAEAIPLVPLTGIQIRSAKSGEKAKKLADSDGLYLFLSLGGTKSWRVAYRFADRRKTVTFGPYPTLTLAEARSRRDIKVQALCFAGPGETRSMEWTEIDLERRYGRSPQPRPKLGGIITFRFLTIPWGAQFDKGAWLRRNLCVSIDDVRQDAPVGKLSAPHMAFAPLPAPF